MNKKYLFFIIQILINLAVFALLLGFNPAQAAFKPIIIPSQPVPNSQPVTMLELQNIIQMIANFFVIIGPIILVISLILSAIMLSSAGANQSSVAKARSWFFMSVVGGLIMFGSGVIINTIAAVISRQFFCRLGFSMVGLNVCIIQ